MWNIIIAPWWRYRAVLNDKTMSFNLRNYSNESITIQYDILQSKIHSALLQALLETSTKTWNGNWKEGLNFKIIKTNGYIYCSNAKWIENIPDLKSPWTMAISNSMPFGIWMGDDIFKFSSNDRNESIAIQRNILHHEF